jgi:8-oxo-dGTP pyrophosphatase MutT (NUDIX family)
MLTPIIAAGGIVLNPNKEILWIFRRGFWDLPKGKLDPNETIEACALREVMEETGVNNLVLGDLILTTKHQYHDMYLNTEVEKTTYWYKMSTDTLQAGIPQTEEDIEAVKWVKQAIDIFGYNCLFQNCGNTFLREDGIPYIEVHHIIPLCHGGEDGLWNLSVLCAHHHRMAHFADANTQIAVEKFLLKEVDARI